ncbi:hypothetical protein PF007_g31815 [Phytophthora fragariae]|uniref:Uncharacterized protein n=1 Tax=Phytophthora fragariae TaxID=53985 RepID=A0A6A3PRP0_9STRA|nr:hypothetical protein PF007_g31815 [Phytophthora fragariae]
MSTDTSMHAINAAASTYLVQDVRSLASAAWTTPPASSPL